MVWKLSEAEQEIVWLKLNEDQLMAGGLFSIKPSFSHPDINSTRFEIRLPLLTNVSGKEGS